MSNTSTGVSIDAVHRAATDLYRQITEVNRQALDLNQQCIALQQTTVSMGMHGIRRDLADIIQVAGYAQTQLYQAWNGGLQLVKEIEDYRTLQRTPGPHSTEARKK